MKRSFWELMLLLLFLITACEIPHFTINEPAAGEVPWTKLEMDRPDDQFQFAIVTDRTGGLRPGVFAEAVDKLNLLQPQFVMSVGDLITGYTEDLPELERQWNEFDAMVDKLDMPFFYVPGNHDITNAVMAKLWTERLGPSYYYFVYKDVLFLCLNTEDQHRGAGRGTISDDQYTYIQQTLAAHEDVRWTLVFMHQPLWDQHHPTGRWPEVAQLLRDRSHTVYAGHVHHYQRFSQNNGKYYTLATTGGGSGLRGPQLGEFDHVSWVTMTEDGPIMANLALDGILPEDLVTKADYDFVRRISESFPVRFELPDRYELSAAGPDTVKLQIHNTTDLPMEAELTPRFSFDYLAALSAEMVEVAPNSVASVELVLHERLAKRPRVDAGSFPLEAVLTYGLSGDQELTIPFNWRLAPLQSYRLREADAYEKLPLEQANYLFPFRFGETVFDTPGDCEVRWDVAVQGDELIVWAEVTDDEVVVRSGETGFRQDYLAVVVNADPLPISILRDGAAWYRESLIFLASPAKGEVPSTTFYADRYDFDIPYHCEATTAGYRFWAKFPLSYIQERQGEHWRNVRINLAVQDEDGGEIEKRRASWQPNWRSAENVVGSGVFFRE